MNPPMTQNDRGEWVPSIPLPFFITFHRYGCGEGGCTRIFWTMEGYRGHYALRHVLDPVVDRP